MKSNISVPVSTKMFLVLVDFLREKGDSRDPVEAVEDAIQYWMDNADWKPELLRQSASYGYQWKSLFLPDGTEVRMQYKGQYYYAKVDADRFVYQGETTTPASMANTIAGNSRNAWRDLWIKRPSDTDWRLADEMRSRIGQDLLDQL